MGNLNIDVYFFLNYLLNPPAIFWHGLWVTIWVSAVSMVLGIIIGLLVALARLSNSRLLRGWAIIYVWFWRGTPPLVQLVLIYTGVAAAGIYSYPDLDAGSIYIAGAIQAAIITLSLNEAAYMSEIFRAAITAIDKGQYDAARAIGMRPTAVMRWVVLPQAARIVMPPLGNEITLMIKGTSLLSVIGVRELFGTLQSINAATFKTFELFFLAAIWYLILTSAVALVQRVIEARLGRHEAPIAASGNALPRRTLLRHR